MFSRVLKAIYEKMHLRQMENRKVNALCLIKVINVQKIHNANPFIHLPNLS
jgi:hypothetical protein